MASGEVLRSRQTQEMQVLNTNFKKVQPLVENLWEIDETIKYNPEFWDNFTIVEANNE